MLSVSIADKYHLEFQVMLPPGVRRAKWQLQLMLPSAMASDGGIPTAERFYRNLLQQQRLEPLEQQQPEDLLRHCRRLRQAQRLTTVEFKRTLADLVNGLMGQFAELSGEALLHGRHLLWPLLSLEHHLPLSSQRKLFRLGRQLALFHYYQALLRERQQGQRGLKRRVKRYLRFTELYAHKHGIRLSHNDEGGREKMVERLSLSHRVIDRPYQLNRHQSKDTKLAEQLIFGLAAALAMAFATGVAFATQQAFGNFSTPFFFSLVFSYIFKDRLKELGRSYLIDRFYARFYQRHFRLFRPDSKGRVLEIRETFFRPKGRELQKRIAAMSALMPSGENPRIEGAWVYCREYLGPGPSQQQSQSRFRDNLTINLSQPLRLLPGRFKTIWQPDPQSPRKINVHRVSSLLLVIDSHCDQVAETKVFRLQVSRKGIHRIKEVRITKDS